MKKLIPTFLMLSLFSLLIYFVEFGEESLVASDGNFLFYNNPVSVDFAERNYIAFVNSKGEVRVRARGRDGEVQNFLVHDYGPIINRSLGMSDDHAAPAIIVDKKGNRLLLATSYHGTDLYIYEFYEGLDNFRLIKEVLGRYTYPRFLEYGSDVYLMSRLQLGGLRGELVVRQASDKFSTEQTILSSLEGEVVYAGQVAKSDMGMVVSYSVHSYKEARLIGWKVVEYDFINGAVIKSCDLSNFLGSEYFTNRPTGIGYKSGSVLVASSYFDEEDSVRAEEKVFSSKNRVLIVKGRLADCENFKIEHDGYARAPYYHTDIAVNQSLDWIYFDGERQVSNRFYFGCFKRDRMMYPSFHASGVVYAVMNEGSYGIRNFKNSIVNCSMY